MNGIFARLFLRLDELKRDERGQDLVEYGLLVSLVALTCIAAISPLANYVNAALLNVSTSLA